MADVLDRFVETVEDYRATVVRVPAAGWRSRFPRCFARPESSPAVLPGGLDPAWRDAIAEAGIAVREDDPPLDRMVLNEIDAVVTAAAVGVAETGTIILDHAADQGRRALTLVPDTHLVVVRADQVVSDVPEAVGRLGAAVAAGNR